MTGSVINQMVKFEHLDTVNDETLEGLKQQRNQFGGRKFGEFLRMINNLKAAQGSVVPNSEYIHVLENGGWQLLSITERTSELAEAMAEEGNLLLRVPASDHQWAWPS